MFTNRVVQLVVRSAFLTFSLFGIINSIIRFCGGAFNKFFFLYFTNLSNYLCFGVMIAVVVRSFKCINKGELYGHNDILYSLKFISTIAIFLTGVVYCCVLYPFQDYPSYFLNVTNLTLHTLCPLLFVLDFFLFDNHFKIRVRDIFYAFIFPLIYGSLIIIFGSFIPNFPYPYFFLNPTVVGYGGVFMWAGIIFAVVTFTAFLFYLYDKTYYNTNKKFKIDLKNKHEIYEYKNV